MKDDTEDYQIIYEAKKLSHRKLINVLFQIKQIIEKEKEEKGSSDIELTRCLSKHEYSEYMGRKDYDAESICGKTENCEAFILTYLAYQIIGGDKRAGRQYITRQQYYQRYSVNDRRDYQEREHTILRKEPEQRNYNARPYIFQLEYKVNNITYVYRAKKFEDILKATNFLYKPNTKVKSPI